MKKSFYFFSLLLGLVFGMVMFTACGSGDDNKNNPESSGVTDFGSDGLKGYWLRNTWTEWDLESGPGMSDIKGQYSRLIYLDGEGGGTVYQCVSTLDHSANNSKYLAGKVGTFTDTVDGSTKDYHFPHLYSLLSKKESIIDETFPLEYFVRGTTMTVYYPDYSSDMWNATLGNSTTSGQISGYHRLNKVN